MDAVVVDAMAPTGPNRAQTWQESAAASTPWPTPFANTEGALTGPRRPTKRLTSADTPTPRDAAALRLVCLAPLI